MTEISFEQVELPVGTVTDAQEFSEARKPADRVWADFGAELG